MPVNPDINPIDKIEYPVPKHTSGGANGQTGQPARAAAAAIGKPKPTADKQVLERVGCNLPKLEIHSVNNPIILTMRNAFDLLHRWEDGLRFRGRYLYDDVFLH